MEHKCVLTDFPFKPAPCSDGSPDGRDGDVQYGMCQAVDTAAGAAHNGAMDMSPELDAALAAAEAAARVIREPAMQNPTLVVLTDRNDLDDQLFGQFQRCADILGQTPVQAASRDQLRELLAVASGGVANTAEGMLR